MGPVNCLHQLISNSWSSTSSTSATKQTVDLTKFSLNPFQNMDATLKCLSPRWNFISV